MAFDVEEGGPTGKGVYTHELAEQFIKARYGYQNVNFKEKDKDSKNYKDFLTAHQTLYGWRIRQMKVSVFQKDSMKTKMVLSPPFRTKTAKIIR